MDRESVLAKCHLHAVLPLLEQIVDYDKEAQQIVSGWNGTVQFSCPGPMGAYIEFKDGKARAYRGTTSWPTVALWFFSPKEMNKLFTGEGFTVPIPWKGLTNLGMLKGFTELTKRLDYYLRTPEKDLPAEHKKFLVTLKLYTAVRALKEIGENDPHFSQSTPHIANGVAELRVLQDGPVAHIRVSHGVLMPGIGPAESPSAVMAFKDIDTANALFNDEIDAMALIGAGDIRLTGRISLIDSMNGILDAIGTYLS